jgi:peptidylprolyl isomerase
MNLRSATTILLATAALVAAGCGDDDEDDTAAQPTTPAATAEAPAATTEAEDDSGTADSGLKISEALDTKPRIPKPEGDPPTQLVVDDVVEGEGAAAKAGDNLTVQYVGVSYSTGEQFDASWDGGQPFPFTLGQGMVIPGWDQGLEGMKAGGRRTLVIPPDLAYGSQGSPPAIAPNETLVFVIDLLEIG